MSRIIAIQSGGGRYELDAVMKDLVGDPDFIRAAKSIAQESEVNVDIAKLMC